MPTRDRAPHVSVFRPGQLSEVAGPIGVPEAERDVFTQSQALALFNPARVWEQLTPVTLQDDFLAGNGLFTNPDDSPAGTAFALLRTRILQAMAERNWRRLGITSPSHGCGKSFVLANLALALARRPDSRTVAIDLDLRRPNLHALFGLSPPGALRDVLEGVQPMESLFLRVGRGLALGLNGEAAADAGDLLHGPDTADALEAIETQLDPDLMLLDLPPALVGDDVLALAGKVDAVLIVTDGTKTTARDLRACEALFEGRIPVLGVALNRAQDRGLSRLRYGRG